MIAIATGAGAVAAITKWAVPSAAIGAAVLAVDTGVITTTITAVQIVLVAILAAMKHRSDVRAAKAKDVTHQNLEATRVEQATTTARIDGQDRLIDQLQEQSTKDQLAIQMARDAMAAAEDGHREVVMTLEANQRRLIRRLTESEIGVMRLVAQIEDLGGDLFWVPVPSPT